MNPDKHQAMRDHLATVVMGWRKNDHNQGLPCSPYYLFPEPREGAWINALDFDPFTNHDQAFQCLDTFKNYSVDKDTFNDGAVFTCTIYDDAEIIDADKLHAICVTMCKATGFEEQQRSE